MRAKGRHRHEEDKVEAGQQGSEKAFQGQMRCNNWGAAPWEFRVPGRTPWGGWSENIKLRLRAGQATRAPTLH